MRAGSCLQMHETRASTRSVRAAAVLVIIFLFVFILVTQTSIILKLKKVRGSYLPFWNSLSGDFPFIYNKDRRLRKSLPQNSINRTAQRPPTGLVKVAVTANAMRYQMWNPEVARDHAY